MNKLSTAEVIAQALAPLVEAVKKLDEKVEILLNPLPPSSPAEVKLPPELDPPKHYPVPVEYREIVDMMLNKKFAIEIEPLHDQPAFNFILVVPTEYSNASPSYLDTYKQDRRPRVITYAQGINGVREWCQRVFLNLSLEARTKIALDREQHKDL